MALTKATKKAILQSLLGQTTSGIASTCYIGLSTTPPLADDGSNFSEPWYNTETGESLETGYERCLLGNATSSTATAKMCITDDGQAYNNAMISFNETFQNYPGTVGWFGLFKTQSNKSELPFLTGTLDQAVQVNAGQIAIFSAPSDVTFETANLKFTVTSGTIE